MDKIIKIDPSSQKNKKYKATIKGDDGNYIVHFGDNRYQQYKDSTGLNKYSNMDHNNITKRRAYFKRHSGLENKSAALIKELQKSKGKINAKILSHKYLW